MTAIFIVEDEQIIARGIEKRLKGLGYSVAGMAASAEQAVAKIAACSPDIVLMDINLGEGMDGIAAAHQLKRILDVPVIYLTAFSDEATLHRAKLSEPHGYLLKPYEDKDLQTVIEIGLYKHKMDRRLRENERWLASTLSSIGDGVIATDEQGLIRFLNPLAEQLTGWPQAKAVGKDVREVFHVINQETREIVPNPAIAALATGVPATLAAGTVLISATGAEYPIDDNASPIMDADGRVAGTVLVFRDVTERNRLEEHLRQAQKMEAIGKLAGGIAHDFNNIMTLIVGFSDLLLSEQGLSPSQRGYVTNIVDAGQRATSLTRQIMAFSRNQALMPAVLSVNTIVRDMAVMVRRLIGEDIQLVIEMAEAPGCVKADPTQLGQIILNLAANARDAMPGGGKLIIGTARTELNATAAAHGGELPSGPHVMLSVMDTGTGMSRDTLSRMFEPFYTTKPFGKGAGIGLTTVYGIVKQCGGHIEVSSELGVGTTFRTFLPVVAEQLPEKKQDFATPLAVAGHETILLVDDEEVLLDMSKMMLERAGYRVIHAHDGREALAVAAAFPDPIDLLVTDMIMPHLSGRELSDHLLAERRVGKVLFISGYTEDTAVLRGVKTDTINFLAKPYQRNDLLKKVREVLDH